MRKGVSPGGRIAAKEQRGRRFRPDDMGRGALVLGRAGGRGAHANLTEHMLLAQFGPPFESLVDVGLHQTQPNVGNHGVAGPGQAHQPAAPHDAEDDEGGGHGNGLAPGPGTPVREHRRHGRRHHAEQAQAIDAGDGRELDHAVREDPGGADQVPRKAGEGPAPDPFERRPRGAEDENAPGAGAAHRAGQEGGAGREKGDQCRQAENGERHHPPEALGFRQQGERDPVKPGREMTEAEPPTGGKGGARSRGRVDQPHQADERGHQQHHQMHRRQGGGGQGAEPRGQGKAAPAGDGGDTLLQPPQTAKGGP